MSWRVAKTGWFMQALPDLVEAMLGKEGANDAGLSPVKTARSKNSSEMPSNSLPACDAD